MRTLRALHPGKRGARAGRAALLQRGAPPGGARGGGQVNGAAPATAVRETSWEALTWFNVYRFLVSFLFVALYWIGQLPGPLGSHDLVLFGAAAHGFRLFSLGSACFIRMRRHSSKSQGAPRACWG